MGRVIVLYGMLIGLSSCTVLTTVATVASFIPTALFDKASEVFQSEDVSLPGDVQHVLAGVQKGLDSLGLYVDVLERVDDSFYILFTNEKFHGGIRLERETKVLTTAHVQVFKGGARVTSIEKALVKSIDEATTKMSKHARFYFHGYVYAYDKPNEQAEHIAWYRRGSFIEWKDVPSHKGWAKVKLLSGTTAYLRSRTLPLLAKKKK